MHFIQLNLFNSNEEKSFYNPLRFSDLIWLLIARIDGKCTCLQKYTNEILIDARLIDRAGSALILVWFQERPNFFHHSYREIYSFTLNRVSENLLWKAIYYSLSMYNISLIYLKYKLFIYHRQTVSN